MKGITLTVYVILLFTIIYIKMHNSAPYVFHAKSPFLKYDVDPI